MSGSSARRTVRPPKPESKTPMMGRWCGPDAGSCVGVIGCVGGVERRVGAEQIGVAGEGLAGLAVDEEADLLDAAEDWRGGCR